MFLEKLSSMQGTLLISEQEKEAFAGELESLKKQVHRPFSFAFTVISCFNYTFDGNHSLWGWNVLISDALRD